MPREERERFLADVRVGVVGLEREGAERAPLLVPIWYAYRPGGEVLMFTGRESVKARLVRRTGRLSLCAQDETPPYRYVSVEGPAVIRDSVDPAEREAMAHRYLPGDHAAAYLEANRYQLQDDITITMRPERWRTADFSAFAASFT